MASSAGPRPPTMAERVAQAVAAHRAGRLDEAEALYQQILDEHPDSADAWHFLGMLRFQRGRTQPALDAMTQALAHAPGHAAIHANLGNMLLQIGRRDLAEAALERAITLDGSALPPLIALAALRHSKGDVVGAEAILRLVLEREPDHAPAHHGMGNVQIALGRTQRGLDHYRRALALDPRLLHVRKLMGRTLSDLGRAQDAAVEFEAYLAVDPDDAGARHLLAAVQGHDAPSRASDDYVRETFDGHSAEFDRTLAELEYRGPALIVAAVEQCLAPPSGALDVLDAGCGTGLVGPRIRPWCRQLTGVDLSPGMLAKARARGSYDHLVEAELTGYLRDGAAETWDLVTCADTLCYFGALEDLLGATFASLRAGGWLFFTTEHDPGGALPLGYRLQIHGRYAHGRAYVEQVLASAGFADVRVAEEPLRLNLGEPVPALIVAARKEAAA